MSYAIYLKSIRFGVKATLKHCLTSLLAFIAIFTVHAAYSYDNDHSKKYDHHGNDSVYHGGKKCRYGWKVCDAKEEWKKYNVSPTPQGYDQYMVFMANGKWRSVDGSQYRDGLIEGDGMYFQKKIMKRSYKEIQEHKERAVQFFYERFGLDVTYDTENFYFTGMQVDPANNLRAYTVSGAHVPKNGWLVRDGGWVVVVTNPDGITLGGEFDGVHVPENTSMVFGEYNIKVPFRENIIIHHESDYPMIPDFGAAIFQDNLKSDDFGMGVAIGAVKPSFLDDNFLMQQEARTIITFGESQ